MYFKQINYFSSLIVTMALLVSEISIADMSSAGAMPPPVFVQASLVVSYYKNVQKKRKLNQDESDKFNLLLIAHDIFGIKEFETIGFQQTPSEKAKALQLTTIALSIEQGLKQKSNWDSSVSIKQWEQISQSESALKTNLGEKSYTAAWLTYRHGNKNEAKSILAKGFEDLYSDTMKLKHLNSHSNSSPMSTSEAFSKALIQMSTDEENKAREKKLNEMRLHVSSLPDLMMMT